MPTFKYKARTREGQMLAATVEAEDARAAARMIREKGLFVAEITEPGRGLRTEIKIGNIQFPPTLKDLAVFCRQLATMIGAGLPLVQSLAVLERQTEHSGLVEITRKVRGDVESGSNLSDALSRHKVFSRLFINLVRAGETSGSLDTILERLAVFMENELALRGKIRTAMTYPVIVFVFAVGVAYFLLTGIVPQFSSILVELGSELPMITRFLMALSEGLQAITPFIIPIAVTLFLAFRAYYRTERGRRVVDGFKLRMPIFGPLSSKTSLSRFSRTLSLLISSGVNIIESLEITRGTAGNAVIEDILEETKTSIQSGEAVSSTLQAHPRIFPPMLSSMVAIGEETGALDTMLSKVADFYEREVDEAVGALTAAIEPAMIIFLGAIVGLIVAGMFLPMFQIIGTLSQ
jgi:type IV pilus assembly protein PilC